jgi:pyruvyltransferase
VWSDAPTGYWWVGRPNFGDLLTPLLMARYAGVSLAWASKAEADCVVVGSVLEHIPEGWDGIVAGAGRLREDSVLNVGSATVLGVRGPLTAASLYRHGRASDVVLGDPGLLSNELVAPVEKQYELGLVPHWSDRDLEQRPEFTRWNPHIIRPAGDPLEVVREIGRCKKIVSSSLHGLIVADAWGIPRRTEMCDIFAKEGGTFKFRDYAATVKLPFVVGKTQEPNRFNVHNKQAELYDMLQDLGRKLTGKSRGA